MAARRKKEIYKLPILPLRGLAIFPSTITHFEVAREKSIKALEEAMENEQIIFLTTQKNVDIELPIEEDFYKFGTICKIKQMLKIPGSNVRVLVEGLSRGKISKLESSEPFFTGDIEGVNDRAIKNEKKVFALMDMIFEAFDELMKETGKNSQVIFEQLTDLEQPSVFADTVASYITFKPEILQSLIEQVDVEKRLNAIYLAIKEELETVEIRKKVDKRVKNQVSKLQKDYYLREQIKAIQKELGEDENSLEDIEAFKEKLKKLNLSETTNKKIEKEIDRLSRMNSASSDYSVTRNYIETILDLPWNEFTMDNKDLNKSIEVLEADHYGLEKVKERIVEFLAVRQLSDKMKAPIICLVGPPGVGKTSIAKSLAKAMDRKFVRISLGGLRDEAEIRGHRRTYVGAMPGRLIKGLIDAKKMNPVIVLDEIDKLGSNHRGDPSAVMLEILDPEQNHEFRDLYLNFPVDLSQVIFVSTANDIRKIPAPLKDRMEFIELNSYTPNEKYHIAKDYLIPQELEKHGLKKDEVSINKATIELIIAKYTREAGVRNLRRVFSKIFRKVVKKILEDETIAKVTIGIKDLKEYLDNPIFEIEPADKVHVVGVSNGLAWTAVGGDILKIEAIKLKGKGDLKVTGNLGDVMKESSIISYSVVKHLIDNKILKIDEKDIPKTFKEKDEKELVDCSEIYKRYDIHLHIPEGATPKDGPSAGITMALALASVLSNRKIKADVAMTGELTLSGKVLPIGGLKEKLIAAYKAKIKKVLIPKKNYERDLDDIPQEVKESLEIKVVEKIEDVLKEALI